MGGLNTTIRQDLSAWERHEEAHGATTSASGSKLHLRHPHGSYTLCGIRVGGSGYGLFERCGTCERAAEKRPWLADALSAEQVKELGPGDAFRGWAGKTHAVLQVDEFAVKTRCGGSWEKSKLRRPAGDRCPRCFPPPVGSPPKIDGRAARTGEVVKVDHSAIEPARAIPYGASNPVAVIYIRPVPGGWEGKLSSRVVVVGQTKEKQ